MTAARVGDLEWILLVFKVGSTLTLEQGKSTAQPEGRTITKQLSRGTRTEWQLGSKDHPGLLIWETSWHNNEREVVIGRPDDVPPMPKELSALLDTSRAGITRHEQFARMEVYMTTWDAKDGRVRKMWPSPDTFEDACGTDLYQALFSHGVVKIDSKEAIDCDESPHRNRTAALLDPSVDVAPIALYVASRVAPILRVAGWL